MSNLSKNEPAQVGVNHPKVLFLVAMCVLTILNITAQPSFNSGGQTIELHNSVLVTSNNNGTTFVENNITYSVTNYRFEFAEISDPTFSLFSNAPNTPPSGANGWWSQVAAGSYGGTLLNTISKLEPGKNYIARICYQLFPSSLWAISNNTVAFTTTVSTIAYYFPNQSTLDLFEVLASATDYNNNYAQYKFEFSSTPTFSDHTNSSPNGLFLNVNFGYNNAPNIGAAASLTVGGNYYVRIKVKTSTMTGWSTAGPVRSFSVVNNKRININNNSNVDLFVIGAVANDNNSYYSAYRFEFSASPSFTEYINNDPTNWYCTAPTGWNNAPNIGAASALEVDKTYYVRVRVKNAAMGTTWSLPGATTTINTVNQKSFLYCNNTALNIETTGLRTIDAFPLYTAYRYEFSSDPTFVNSQSHPLIINEGNYTQANTPLIHTTLPNMLYNTKYYARIRVKTNNMLNWSNPGPVCTFTTASCMQNNFNSCPTFSVGYVPNHYYSFDNNCAPRADCMSSSIFYDPNTYSSVPTYYNDDYDWNAHSRYVIESGKVGKCFKTKLKPTSEVSYINFPLAYPSNSSGDLTIEFGFKLGFDGYFILSPLTNTLNPNFSLPHFQINPTYIRCMLDNNGNAEIRQNFAGLGLLSPGYYFDHNWHHAAIKYNATSRYLELYIDGQSPTEFKTTIPSSVTIQAPLPISCYQFYVGTSQEYNYLDELMTYDQALPENIIYQHYLAFQSGNHFSASTVNNTITIPPSAATTGTYDPFEYVPGYGAAVLAPGNANTYYHCDLAILDASVATASQLESYPLPRFKANHSLNPNINWTDTKYLAMTYSGSCAGNFNPSWDAGNECRIQLELCKNWNYMFSLPNYNNNFASNTGVVNATINANPQYKLALITNMYEVNYFYNLSGYRNDINSTGVNLSIPTFSIPSSCGYPANTTTFPDPQRTDYYTMLGRTLFKNVVQQYIEYPLAIGSTSLSHKIDFVSENSWEDRITYPGGCVYNTHTVCINEKNSIIVPANSMASTSASPTWNDWGGLVAGRYYKAYADGLINETANNIYASKKSSNIFNYNGNVNNTKFLFYLITGMKSNEEDPFFDNYNTKRICNSVYTNTTSAGTGTMIYSTPNFYPAGGPFGWFTSGGPSWGLDQMWAHTKYEVGIGDHLFAPFVSARWGRDVNSMRPGQYLGFLKAISMHGVDFFHAGYFNITDQDNNSKWRVKMKSSDPIGFANDPRTWVWQLAITSYAQANNSRFENIIRDGVLFAIGKYGSEYYVVRKQNNVEKYIVFATNQNSSNYVGSEATSKDIYLSNFSPINNFKVNARRQGSTYVLDKTNSPPVFYQLDKWHEATHPSYWSKDFDFEAEVNDTGNDPDRLTELPQNAVAGDYTNFTTGAKLNGSANSLGYKFTPRSATANNDYQIWIRMKHLCLSSSTNGTLGIKIDGVNTYVIDGITNCNWQWFGYESCGSQRMLITNLTSNEHEITLVSGSNNLIIDQVCIKTNTTLTWQTQPLSNCSGCCSYNYRIASVDSLKNLNDLLQYPSLDSEDIELKPNPANGSCIVSSAAMQTGFLYTISLTTLLGTELLCYDQVANGNSIEINTSRIPAGVYNISISEAGTKLKKGKKLVVNHD